LCEAFFELYTYINMYRFKRIIIIFSISALFKPRFLDFYILTPVFVTKQLWNENSTCISTFQFQKRKIPIYLFILIIVLISSLSCFSTLLYIYTCFFIHCLFCGIEIKTESDLFQMRREESLANKTSCSRFVMCQTLFLQRVLRKRALKIINI
jgi:hypothetical protein